MCPYASKTIETRPRARAPETGMSWILLPQMLISLLSWIQLILSMNRYRGVKRFSRGDAWALLIFLHGGLVRWVAVLALAKGTVRFQILSALVGSLLAWIAFVVVFNGGFVLPSHQQLWALVMSLVITVLWEVSNRLALELV